MIAKTQMLLKGKEVVLEMLISKGFYEMAFFLIYIHTIYLGDGGSYTVPFSLVNHENQGLMNILLLSIPVPIHKNFYHFCFVVFLKEDISNKKMLNFIKSF